MIRHLTGVYKADEGEILIDGEPVFENRNIKQRMAYIPDELFYFMQADTMEMKRFYEGIYPQFDSKLFYKMQEIFPTIDVKRTIRRLSKGMQKQVAFWLAICCKPDLLILDEPVDGLDPVMRRQIWSILMAEVAERKYQDNLRAKGPEIKLGRDHAFANFVERKIIEEHYSPGAVLAYIEAAGLEFETHICETTLYSYIYRGDVFLELTEEHLLYKGERRRDYEQRERAKEAPGDTIEDRPPEVRARNTFGHWEMDSIMGWWDPRRPCLC